MRFPFQLLPGGQTLRPVVPVSFPSLKHVQLLGLVDSGAIGTRIRDDIAELLGIDLSEVGTHTFYIGDHPYTARAQIIEVLIGSHLRLMRVDFVENWNHEHALLGIKGFFEEFVVRIDALKRETNLSPTRRHVQRDLPTQS